MKLAIMLAGVASGNRLAGDPTRILQQGARVVRSNPQLSALGDQVRDQLVDAGKNVAVAALSRQMESLNQRLAAPADPVGRVASARGRATSRGRDAGDPDEAVDDEGADAPRDDARDEEPRRRRREREPESRRTGAKRPPAPASGSGSAAAPASGSGSGSAKKKSTATKAGGGKKAATSSSARSATSGSRTRRDAPAPQARRGGHDG